MDPSLSAHPRTRYLMPVTLGQAPLIHEPGFYAETTAITIIYRIAYEAAAALLPTWVGDDGKRYGFRPLPAKGDDPLIMFTYAQMHGVNALAWGSYNALAITLTVEFVGERPWTHEEATYDGAQGTFYLLVLENNAWACMIGREVFGVPKLHTPIPDPRLLGGRLRLARFAVKAQRGRQRFVRGRAVVARVPRALEALLTPKPRAVVPTDEAWGTPTAYEPTPGSMGWKHIPHPDGNGSDLSYAMLHHGGPTLLPGDTRTELTAFDAPMIGSGRVRLKSLLPGQFPEGFQAVNRLKWAFDRHCKPFPFNAILLHYPHYVLTGHRLDGPVMPADASPAPARSVG